MGIQKILADYRPNVGIALFNKGGKVFYGHRYVKIGKTEGDVGPYRWQMPQGGIDAGEDMAAAAFRELKEETGVSSARLLAVTPGWLTYEFPKEYKRKKWKGQRQKWAAMLFEGDEAEIDLEADDHQEFDDWRWGDLEEAIDLIVPFKRDVYSELVTSLIPLRNFIVEIGGRESA